MAERGVLTVADRWRPYRVVLGSHIRAQRAYPVSFRLDVLAAVLIGATEFGEVWVIFHNVPVIGGVSTKEILIVFGLANVAFASADALVGHMDQLSRHIRAGTLDAFYLRPQPLLSQLLTSDFQMRRLGRVAVGASVLIVGLVTNEIAWNGWRVVLLLVTIPAGILIFAALFVAAGGVQFFLVNGAEVTNAFTYGGAYASAQPGSLFRGGLKVLFGYLVPAVFTGYLPALALLGQDPHGYPSWLIWCLPLAAAWTWGVALLIWRAGVRHYQGGGG